MSDNIPEAPKDKLKYQPQTHSFPEFKTKQSIPDEHRGFSPGNKADRGINKNNNEDEARPWPKPAPNQSEAETEQLLAKAQKDGFDLGFKEGRVQEMKRVDQLRDMISVAINDMEVFKRELLKHAERSIIDLVTEISNKIILSEPSIDSKLILKIVENALKMVIDPSHLKIKVNQDDLNTLIENKNSLETALGKTATVKIESDPNVSIGGCVIETDFGDIDARLENQLKIIHKSLKYQFDLFSQKTVS